MTRRLLGRAAPLALAIGLLTTAAPAPAQVVIVRARSAEGLVEDFRTVLATLSSGDDAKKALEALDQLRAPDALKGLDRSRPVGAFADFPKEVGQPFALVAFVPVTDGKVFLATLEDWGFLIRGDVGVPGFSHKITVPGEKGQEVFLLLTESYAYFSLTPAGAAGLRTLKPAALLPGRPGAGDLALSVRLDRIPAPYKDGVLDQMERDLEPQRRRRPDEKEAEYQGRLVGMKVAQELITGMIRDGRELALDLDIEPQRGDAALELRVTAAPGTPMATSLRAFGARRSLFGGLGPGAALGAWLDLPLAGAFRTAFTQAFDQARRQAEEQATDPAAKQAVIQVLDALQPTLTGEDLDLGLAVHGPFAKGDGPPTFVLVAGIKVKDGARIEAAFRDLARRAKPEDQAKITLDAAKSDDGRTTIHRVRGDSEPAAAAPFGRPDAFLAVRDDVALVAIGEDGLAVLNRALAATTRPPAGLATQAEAAVSVARLAQMVTDADREVTQATAREAFGVLDAAKDRIHLSLRSDGDALLLRLATDLPVLRFFTRLGARTNKGAAAAP